MNQILFLGLDQEEDKSGIVSQNENCEFIGLEYVNAYLNQKGIEGKVIYNFKNIQDITKENPLIVGFSVMASNYEPSRRLSKELKRVNPKTIIVWGGQHATNYYEEVLKENSVDYIVMGEGEKTFFNLTNNIIKSNDISSLEGITFFDGEKIIKNPKPSRLTSEELDEIDFKLIHLSQDHDIFFSKHMPHSIPASEMNFAMLVGSRGCWNNCSFCSNESMWRRRIIYRSPSNIVDELEHLVKDKNVNFVFFGDDDFLINEDWCKSIAKEIIKREIKTNYHIMSSVHSASKFNYYDLLKKSGCCEITLGMETTTQHILDSIGKGYEISRLPPIANEITSHNIHLGLYYMLGYSNQTQEDLNRDIEFIQKIPFSRIRSVFLTPYPGTKLYEEVEKKNLWLDGCRNNWSILTNDRPVIKSEVSPEELIKARKNVLELYFTDEYKTRMRSMYEENIQSEQAFEEFQSFLKEVILR